MTDELKPVRCGCGGEAYYEAYENYNFGSYIAHIMICDKCGMRTAEWPSEAEAVQAWNRAMAGATDTNVGDKERTAKVEEDEWIEHKMLSRDYGKIYYQHDCCCNLYESPYNFCPYCGKKMKRKNHE